MKRLIILTTILPLLVVGCRKSYDCPPKVNTTVYFTLKDNANNEVFTEVVNHVELFIYDCYGFQTSRSTIYGSDLSTFAGKRLWLEPGTYTIIVWANTTNSYSRFFINDSKPCSDIEQNYLLNAVAVNGVVANSDPLYYAPKKRSIPLTIIVPERGNVEAVAEFRHAHVKLDISVEGYNHVSSRTAADPLKIELTDITSRYCFEMGGHGNKVSYLQNAPNTDLDNKIFRTSFNIPVFNRNSTTQICVTNNAGQLIISPISLVEILDEKINIDELQHLPVRIIFTEEDGTIKAKVTVDLPQWNEENVEPF